MIVYADTSFIFPLYLPDQHSLEATTRMAQVPDLVLTPLHRCELAHAFERRVFERTADREDVQLALRRFEADLASGVWRTTQLPESAFDGCISLAHGFTATIGCRTLEALHVASALELGADAFWTFDDRQRRLAEAAGLEV